MIEGLLKQAFPLFYGKDPQSITVPLYRTSAPFAETDAASCNRCQSLPERACRRGCNRETTSHQAIMEYGFTFMQVKYPSAYVW